MQIFKPNVGRAIAAPSVPDIDQIVRDARSAVFLVPQDANAEISVPKYIAQSAAAVKVGATDVIVERLGADGGRAALATIVRELHSVPPEVRGGIQSVMGAGGKRLDDFVRDLAYPDGDGRYTGAEYNTVNKSIVMYRLADLEPAKVIFNLNHEIGHHIETVEPAAFRGWAEIQRRDMAASRGVTLMRSADELHAPQAGKLGVTGYGDTSVSEDIAESLALLRLEQRNGPVARRTDGAGGVPVTFAELYPHRTAAILQTRLGAAFVTRS
ncbi:MAG: hypothetical protein JWM90_2338 [Thermoleophilia bacterium]|nr:hypothetical protein [Thermoleophilia bacterium]